MTNEMNIHSLTANADAIVATQNAFDTPTGEVKALPCTYCGKPIPAEELVLLMADEDLDLSEGSADAMCDACASESPVETAPEPEPAVDEEAMLLAELKAEEEKAERIAKLAAQIAKLKAKNAKLQGNSQEKPAAENPAANSKPAATAADTLLPTDIRLGVINPKHLTARDKAFLQLLADERTDVAKLKNPNSTPGTIGKAVYHWFKQRKYSQDWVNALLGDMLKRNVISKMYAPTIKGKRMLVLFDAQWRANIARDHEVIGEDEILKANAIYGK